MRFKSEPEPPSPYTTLVNTMFISNNRSSFHLWWKGNLVKHRQVSKYYETDCRLHVFYLWRQKISVELAFDKDLIQMSNECPKKYTRDIPHKIKKENIKLQHFSQSIALGLYGNPANSFRKNQIERLKKMSCPSFSVTFTKNHLYNREICWIF